MTDATPTSRLTLLSRVICPHCWHQFAPEDSLWVAEHPELMGDAKLGDMHAMRFLPSRFSPEGDAIDPEGCRATRLACPNCHLEVPRPLYQIPAIFYSILGAPACGKSYFLASMTWKLRQMLPARFHISLNDADAGANARLHHYEEQQFLNADPDVLVSIAKTETQGDLYDQVRMGDHSITLPRPFMFSLQPTAKHPNRKASSDVSRVICLYDNAGESFLPGADTVSSPVTRHLALSACLFFCFDPTQDPRFRRACEGKSDDPQMKPRANRLAREASIRQDTVLLEAIQRVRRHAGLREDQLHQRPMIIVVTKWDSWKSLLPEVSSKDPYFDLPGQAVRTLDSDRIRETSGHVEQLLQTLCPEVVAAAQGFARDLTFIPVSATGVSPEVDPQTGTLGIRPRDIQPYWVEVPLLYALSTWSRGLVGSQHRVVSTVAEGPPISPRRQRPARRRPPVSMELLYTSAASGLRQGSRGFCTVLSTRGMPLNLANRLETLSGYRHVYPPHDALAGQNPVCWSHVRVKLSGRQVNVVSRVAAHGVDYSGRTNKLAHHVIVERQEQPPAGPAWLVRQTDVMRSGWDGRNETPDAGPTIPAAEQTAAVCHRWQSITGDAGWGGALAEAFASPADKPQWIIFSIEQQDQLLSLIDESIALLPAAQRWKATFSTYYTNLPPEVDCRVRCVLAGSEEARAAAARRIAIDLTQPMPAAGDAPLVQQARGGVPATDDLPAALVSPETATPMALADAFSGSEDDGIDLVLAPLEPPSHRSGVERKPPAVQGSPPPRLPQKAAAGKARLCFAIAGVLALALIGGVFGARQVRLINAQRAAEAEAQAAAEAAAKDREDKEKAKAIELDNNFVELKAEMSALRVELDASRDDVLPANPELSTRTLQQINTPNLNASREAIKRLEKNRLAAQEAVKRLSKGLEEEIPIAIEDIQLLTKRLDKLQAEKPVTLIADLELEREQVDGGVLGENSATFVKLEQYVRMIKELPNKIKVARDEATTNLAALNQFLDKLESFESEVDSSRLPPGRSPPDVKVVQDEADSLRKQVQERIGELPSRKQITAWKDKELDWVKKQKGLLTAYGKNSKAALDALADVIKSRDRIGVALEEASKAARTVWLTVSVNEDGSVSIKGNRSFQVIGIGEATLYEWDNEPGRPLTFTHLRSSEKLLVPPKTYPHVTASANKAQGELALTFFAVLVSSDTADEFMNQCYELQELLNNADETFLVSDGWVEIFAEEDTKPPKHDYLVLMESLRDAFAKLRLTELKNTEASKLLDRLADAVIKVQRLRKRFEQIDKGYDGEAYSPKLSDRITQLGDMANCLEQVRTSLGIIRGGTPRNWGTVKFYKASGGLSPRELVENVKADVILRVGFINGASE